MVIRELSSNLTGGQIQRVLDYLLFKTMEPLVLHTCIVEHSLPKILINIITDRRRKISALPFEQSILLLNNAILQKNQVKTVELIKNLKIERNIWSKLITDFLSIKKEYQSLFGTSFTLSTAKKKLKIEKVFECSNLWTVFCDVEYYFSQYSKFRGMIHEQYIQQSHKLAHEIGDEQVNHQDLHQLLLMAVSKGLDKYDSSSGALSSYLGFWQMNVRSSMHDQFTNTSIAFDVPNSYRQKIAMKEVAGNWSQVVIIEQDNENEPFTDEDDTVDTSNKNRLLKIIKIGDIDGIYRLSNNIEEIG